MRFARVMVIGSVTAVAMLAPVNPVLAEPLAELIPDLIKTSDAFKAAKADLDAADENIKAAYGGWYPDVKVVGWGGKEHFRRPNTDYVAKEFDVTLTQLIYDFGKTDSKIESKKLAAIQAEAALTAARQQVLLEAASAYVSLFRYAEALNYARQSEDNIRKQTGLEKARVDKGAGVSTDVLQSATQLADAQARRVQAQNVHSQALNKFRKVFKREPGNMSTFRRVMLPPDLLPASQEDALAIALENNPSLKSVFLNTRLAREQSVQATAEGFYPKIEAIADIKFKQHVSGTLGNKKEETFKTQVTWPFNLGFTAVNTIKAAEHGVAATENRLAEAKLAIEEQLKNTWQMLTHARELAGYRHDQAGLAEATLENARKERELGTRSLTDVLAMETAHINAITEELGAEADIVVQGLTLMWLMGRFEMDTLTTVATFGTAAAPRKPKKPASAQKATPGAETR